MQDEGMTFVELIGTMQIWLLQLSRTLKKYGLLMFAAHRFMTPPGFSTNTQSSERRTLSPKLGFSMYCNGHVDTFCKNQTL